MVTFNTDQITAYQSTNPLFPSGFSAAQLATFQANVQYGKLRILRYDWTSPAGVVIGDVVQLCRIPNGRVTMIPSLSLMRTGAFGASVTAAIGNAAYRDQSGAVVAASSNSILAATSVAAAGTLALVQAAPSVGLFSFESQGGVFLTATFAGANPASSILFNGYFVIAVE